MEEKVCFGVNLTQYLLIGVQVDQVFRWIQLGLAIVCSIVLLGYRVWKWYKEAKSDGKITEEEVREIIKQEKDNVVSIVEDTKDLIEDIAEKKDK